MRKMLFAGAAAIASMLALSMPASAQVIGIATGQPGSLGFNTGQTVAKVLSLHTKLKVRTQPMAGTAAYLPLVNRGLMDFGFCNATEAYYAMSGTGDFAGKPNPNLRMVGMMFPLRTGLAVAADTGIKTIHDLAKFKGKLRIASGYKASRIIPYYIAGILADGGMKYSDFKEVPVSGFVDGIKALGDGRVDITLISLGSAGGRKVNEELKSRGGWRYVSLDPSPKAFADFERKLPSGSIITLKANPKMPGLLEPKTNIVAIPWVMVTNKKTPDKLVHTVVKTLLAHYPELGSTFAAFKHSGPKDFAPKSKVPYHPGALSAIKEANIPH